MQAVLCAVFATLVLGYVQAQAQDCSSDVVKYVHCMKDAIEKKKADFEAKKPQITACFNDNGCGGSDADSGEQGYPEPPPEGGMKKPNLTDAQKQCLADKFEAIGLAKLENCTGKPVPAWVKKAIDTLKAEMKDKNGYDHKKMGGHHKGLHNCTNKDAVKRCIEGVIGQHNGSDKCDLSDKCASQSFMTYGCKPLIEDFKNDACGCFSKKHHNDSDENEHDRYPRNANHGKGGYGKQRRPGQGGLGMIQEVFQQCNITFDLPNGNQRQRPPQNGYQRPPAGYAQAQNQGQNQPDQAGNDDGHKKLMKAHKMKGFRPPLCDCGDDEDDD